MRVQHLHATAAGALALALGACSGGGGGGVNPTPFVPTPTPTPTPTGLTVIEAADSSQEFAGKGATIELGQDGNPAVSTADSEQIRIRYNAATKTYEVQVPGAQWMALRLGAAGGGDNHLATSDHTFLALIEFAETGYQYSALARWNRQSEGLFGGIAFGIPTRAGAVPVSGSATYMGTIAGHSTESDFDYLAGTEVTGWIDGSITLLFNFGAGTLSGSIEPTVWTYTYQADLPILTFINTVYSVGSTTFSGQFDTSLAGANAFSGQFTGPAAQELIGSFQFPYRSPDDGNVYQATGAFVGK